jgi:hypothetical protein
MDKHEIAKRCAERLLGKGVTFYLTGKDIIRDEKFHKDIHTYVYLDMSKMQYIIDSINVPQYITLVWEDKSSFSFYGCIDEYIPLAVIEGEMPRASVTLIPIPKEAEVSV